MTSPEAANPVPDFRGRIDAITGRVLTPENIDAYAERALTDLVGVIDDATGHYRNTVDAALPNTAFGERIAFQRFGLDGDEVASTLNRIDGIIQEVAGLDDIISSVKVRTHRIILPPAEPSTLESTGESPRLTPRQTSPRLKTLMFILSNRYDVDIANQAECMVTDGPPPSAEIRSESYNTVVVPSLNRTVLVCDESGNATYIFDTARLEAAGIDQEKLEGMNKAQLRQYLEATPRGGYRLLYDDDTFTARVTSLLDIIPAPNQTLQVNEESGKFLGSWGVPVGMHRRGRVARELGVTYNAVDQAVEALGDELGVVQIGGQKNSPVYSPSQRKQIRAWLAGNGYLSEAAATEGEEAEAHTTVNRMTNDFSVGFATVQEAIAALGEELGETGRERVQGVYTTTYSAGQRAQIRSWLVANNKIAADEEAAHVPISYVADLVGVSGTTLRTLITAHADEIGEIKAISNKGKQLSPAQQGTLMGILAKGGYLAEKAPAGAVVETNLPQALGYSRRAAAAAVASGVAGEPGQFMIGDKNARPGRAFTVAQQNTMRHWLEANGYARKDRALGATAGKGEVTLNFTDPPMDKR